VVTTPGEFYAVAGGSLVVLLLVFVGLRAVWDWRQSKVDLIALEERIQAKRAKDPRFQVEGLTERELEDLSTWRFGLVRRLTYNPLFEPAARRRRRRD
jgi:hypothetical protein